MSSARSTQAFQKTSILHVINPFKSPFKIGFLMESTECQSGSCPKRSKIGAEG